jgi:hypothetical protein
MQGQHGRKELRTDSGLVVLHHFKTGELSTKEWRDKDDRFGLTTAYDRAGKEIFRYGTRRIGGHASVHFSYHANGAISMAEASDAPDAGIQWFRSTTTFDDQGNRTGYSEDTHEDLLRPSVIFTQPEQPLSPVVPQPPPTAVPCQRMFVNEVFVVNGSSWPVEITVEPKDPSPALVGSKFILPAGGSLRVAGATHASDRQGDEQARQTTPSGRLDDGRTPGGPPAEGVVLPRDAQWRARGLRVLNAPDNRTVVGG